MGGIVQTCKAKTVVKGYKQIYIGRFWQNFIVIVTYHEHEIWEIDVNTIFLNENI